MDEELQGDSGGTQGAGVGSGEDGGGGLWLRALGAVVLAILANLGVWWIGVTVVSVPSDFPPLDGPGPTIFFTAVGAVGAAIVYKLVSLRASTPDSLFRGVAVAVLLLSFVPDVLLLTAGADAVPGVTVPGVAILMVMHVVAAAVIVRVLTGSLTSSRTGRRAG